MTYILGLKTLQSNASCSNTFLVFITKIFNRQVIELKSLLHGDKHIGVGITARRDMTGICTFSSPINWQAHQNKANQTAIYVTGHHKRVYFTYFGSSCKKARATGFGCQSKSLKTSGQMESWKWWRDFLLSCPHSSMLHRSSQPDLKWEDKHMVHVI